MKVLFISQYFWPESFRGNDLAFDLVRRGHRVTVLTGKPNYPSGKFFEGYGFFHPKEEWYRGVRIIRTPIVPRGHGKGWLLAVNYASFVVCGFFTMMLRLGRDYDVIFVQQLSPVFAALPGVWMKKRLRVPMVLWVLDLWPESITAASKVRSPVLIRWVTRIVRQVYDSADVILMSSRSYSASIRGNTSGQDKSLEYFPNWAEDVFSRRGGLPGSLPQSLPEGFKVMFAGNFGEAQDFATILAAAQLTLGQDVNWLLIGSGRKIPWIKDQIVKRGLTNVFLFGHHPLETIPLFFAQADVMLLSLADNPLFQITVPAKLQAYMASGKVIVGVLAGEGAEVLRASGGGLLVSPGNAQALADAVLKVRQMSPRERLDIASKSRRYYDEHFAREQRIDRLEQLFERLVMEGRDCRDNPSGDGRRGEGVSEVSGR
jgi:glycosyltransferase involved in cell wall biosynthesis